MIHWWLIHLGVDDTNGPWYAWWSGFGADLGEITLFGAIIAATRHKNCFVKGCWRLGHPDPEHGHPACRKHHSRIKALNAAQARKN